MGCCEVLGVVIPESHGLTNVGVDGVIEFLVPRTGEQLNVRLSFEDPWSVIFFLIVVPLFVDKLTRVHHSSISSG